MIPTRTTSLAPGFRRRLLATAMTPLLVCSLGVASLGASRPEPGAAQASAPRQADSRGDRAQATVPSLLDHLPRINAAAAAGARDSYTAALTRARNRGTAGRADALWIEFFYGDAAAKARAEQALRSETGGAASGASAPEMAFLQFFSAYVQGQDQQMLQAALRLAEVAPNDVATEVAVRALSGSLEKQGKQLINAVPALQHVLTEPLQDPATVYMLGRSLLAAVHAPGVDLPETRALRLAGRLPHWQLWGPFGPWQNLDFDRTFPIERSIAATYADGGQSRRPVEYNSAGGAVRFPADWHDQGVQFGVSYLRLSQPERVLLRFYSSASAEIEINGVTVIRNDRRTRYVPATQAAAALLQPGWNRIVVKLAGDGGRDFDLMLRPASGPIGAGTAASADEPAWENAAQLPAGATLAEAPKPLPAPLNLAAWSTQRLSTHPDDAVALWVDGIRRLEDEDAEHARVELSQATQLVPRATPVWLQLAEADGALDDASQSWMAAQVEAAAQQALKTDPNAVRAHDRLGHVYESQGKDTQAAEQYAACAGKGYASCDWSAFHLAATKNWRPEAETALSHALAESGSDWGAIASGMEFYASMGDAARLEQWTRVLRADPRAAGVLGIFDLRHGHPRDAVTLLATAMGFEPSSPALGREYLEALLQTGDMTQAESAAKQALARFPYDAGIAAEVAQIQLRRDPVGGLAALHQTDASRGSLRREANFLGRDTFWMPWYHSAAEILKDAPGKAQYPNASAILVFDQMVNRVNPDNSQDQYIHQIYRVLNAAGISALGTANISPGSDLITVRTIKQNGVMLLPENTGNLQSISMPGLEPGDFIETEYVQHMPPSRSIPGTMNNDEFFVFNSSKQPYHYSDYIVLTPPNYPLLIDQERFPAPPKVTRTASGDTAREWLIQKTRVLVTEPHMPPEVNLVPRVWVSSPSQWAQISDYLSDHLYAVQRTTPEMQAEAAKLAAGQTTDIARANAIFQWVATHIQPEQASLLAPARQSFTDGSGSRQAVFMALLSAVHIPFQLALTRGSTDDSSIKIPSLFEFQYPLIHVGAVPASNATPASNAAGWYDLSSDFARLDYITPAVRGALALVAPAHLPESAAATVAPLPSPSADSAFTRVPDFRSPLDSMLVSVQARVSESGDAAIHLELDFHGPEGEQMREALADQPSSSLPQIYQQLALASYPNAIASDGKIENLTDKTKPLIITMDAEIPGFVTVNGAAAAGASWDIEHLVGDVGLLARYAPLPFRTHPLVIAGSSSEQTEVTLTLPARFGQPSLPADARLSNRYGVFQASYHQQGNDIVFHRSVDLHANLIQPDQYAAFRNFAEAVDNHDRLRITGVTK